MPSFTKWNVVPPGRTHGARTCEVSTNTGVWNGASSGHITSPASNMRLPMMLTPVRANVRATRSSSVPVSPPSPSFSRSRKKRVGKIQLWSLLHWDAQSSNVGSPTWARSMPGGARYPSRETLTLKNTLLICTGLSPCGLVVKRRSRPQVIGP